MSNGITPNLKISNQKLYDNIGELNLGNESDNQEGITNEELEKYEQEQVKPIDPRSYIPVMDSFTTLTGTDFVNSKNEKLQKIEDEVFSCRLIAYFFSGWGSPCHIFEKKLLEIYNEVNDGEILLQIIELNFEKDEEKFKKNISGKPWVFLPFNSPKLNEIKDHYKVISIPQFFPVDKKGNVIAKDTRKDLYEFGSDLCDEWIKYVEELNIEENGNDEIKKNLEKIANINKGVEKIVEVKEENEEDKKGNNEKDMVNLGE